MPKPLDEFYANRSRRDGTRPECKDCTKARRKRWYAENPRARDRARARVAERPSARWCAPAWTRVRAAGKKKVSDRKSHLKRKYGLTLEGFEQLLASQGGGCAICGKPDVDNVDHDHATGQVRGILCWNCNIAIGQLEDDVDRALRGSRVPRSTTNSLTSPRSRVVALAG